MRYIDATDPELNEALERGDAFDVLVRACGAAEDVGRVLSSGFAGAWPDLEAPGYLRYLILCCAVVARSDANSETKNFRINLAAAFGSESTFNSLHELPELWKRLKNWCEYKQRSGEPIREIVLPDDHKWARNLKYVGLTQAITFPAWRDLQHMRSIVGHSLTLQGLVDPFDAAKRLPQLIEHDAQFSNAMREAVEEYRRLYEASASMLHRHRFWKAIRGVLGAHARKTGQAKLEPRIELSFSLDLYDTTMSLSVADAETGKLTEGEDIGLTDSVEEVSQALPRWSRQMGFAPAEYPILRVFSEGAVPFFEEGLGIWVASHRRPLHQRRCVVLHLNRGGGRIGGIASPARWIGDRCAFSDVLSAEQVRAVFDELSRFLGTTDLAPTRALEPKLIGGFKTGSAYLGRVCLLPKIEAPGGGKLRLGAHHTGGHEIEVELTPDGYHRITAAGTLSGTHLLRYVEQPLEGVEPLIWQKDLIFVPTAYEHEKLGEANPRDWVRIDEYSSDYGPKVPIAFENEVLYKGWENDDAERAQRFDDFLEAVYARGRSGWTEPQLIETAKGVLGPDQPSPWDILRSLEESTWLVCRQASAWRARKWWLQNPKLFFADEQGKMITVLGGSAPEAIRRRFSTTAINLGATYEERVGVGPYTPRLCTAIGIDPNGLAKELGWSLEPVPAWPRIPAPSGWPVEGSDPSSHQQAGSWNWRRGRFESNPSVTSDAVRLDRFARARRDRRDLFVVTSGNAGDRRVYSSRVAAIVEAYRRADSPLFALEGSRLMRLPHDGHLPLPLALGVCLRSGRASGPVRSSGGWCYAYPADDWIVKAIRRTLGEKILAGKESTTPAELTPAELVGRRRHRA